MQEELRKLSRESTPQDVAGVLNDDGAVVIQNVVGRDVLERIELEP